MSRLALQQQKLQQRIHREELKLARLKTKANKQRRQDARLKLRLGGFLYLLNWQSLPEKTLSDRLASISEKLANADADETDRYRTLGENTLQLIVKDRTYDPSSPGLNAEERRAENHQKISIGGLLVKFNLHEFDRATLFGALLEFNQQKSKSKKSAQNKHLKKSK